MYTASDSSVLRFWQEIIAEHDISQSVNYARWCRQIQLMVCDRIFLDKSPLRLGILITQVLEVDLSRASFIVCNMWYAEAFEMFTNTGCDLYRRSQLPDAWDPNSCKAETKRRVHGWRSLRIPNSTLWVWQERHHEVDDQNGLFVELIHSEGCRNIVEWCRPSTGTGLAPNFFWKIGNFTKRFGLCRVIYL